VEQPARSKFRVVGPLGRGSITDGYLCRVQGDGGPEQEVVVKRVHADYSGDPFFVGLLLDETRLVAGLNHPNIARQIEVGQDESGPYIAMEYVPGVSLATIITKAHQNGAVHHGHFSRLMAGVCDGLEAAHGARDAEGKSLGIIHRDVKPSAIRVTREGIPKVLDFGMAMARGRLASKQVASFRRNLRYMAPEQISQAGLDHRADVYGAGVTLYELTTGQNPFGSDVEPEVQVLDRILNGEFPRPSEVAAGYPGELEAIVLAAMATEVSGRMASAAELRDRLEAFARKPKFASDPATLVAWLGQLRLDFSGLTKAGEIRTPTRNPPPVAVRRRPRSGRAPRTRTLAALGIGVVGLAAFWVSRHGGMSAGDDATVASPAAAPAVARAAEPQTALEPEPAAEPDPPGRAGIKIEKIAADSAPLILPTIDPIPPRQRPLSRRGAVRLSRRSPPPAALAVRPAAPVVTILAGRPSGQADPAPSRRIPVPPVPRVFVGEDAERIARMFQAVENAAVARAGVSLAFAEGITAELRKRLRPDDAIYPAAMYYFIVREAAAGRDRRRAASNLAAAQSNGLLLRSRDLTPGR
jgi:eukaryotic-like serine/threonine-protein kinase